ncbi:hypothetical protein [Streptomyces sp. NPDC050504]|uniref:hypothetical protein n=1 Tax=Streptomyces sp. NPDC050504 TaxID=3365618 RepID=UPI0037BAD085
MDTREVGPAASEAEARAAFVSRSAGPALVEAELRRNVRELLPGEVDATSDTETFLAALAGYAARCPEPAGSAVWGLDLASGALRRTAVPEAGGPVAHGAGLTWVGALEAALVQHCEGILARRLASPDTRVPRLRLEPAREPAVREGRGVPATGATPGDPAVPEELLRVLRAQGEPVAHDLTGLLSLPACALRLDRDGGTPSEPDTVVATGATRADALSTAAARVLALKGHRAAGRPGPLTVPAIGRDREPGSVRVRPPAQWSTPLDALRADGHSPVALLLDHDTRLSRVLPYAVRIVLSAR